MVRDRGGFGAFGGPCHEGWRDRIEMASDARMDSDGLGWTRMGQGWACGEGEGDVHAALASMAVAALLRRYCCAIAALMRCY